MEPRPLKKTMELIATLKEKANSFDCKKINCIKSKNKLLTLSTVGFLREPYLKLVSRIISEVENSDMSQE